MADVARSGAWPGELSGVRADLDRHFRDNPFMKHLGASLVDWDLGRATVALSPGPDLANIAGTVHGGALTSLADISFEVASNSYGRICVATSLTALFTRAVSQGTELLATCHEMSRLSRVASYRIELTLEGGEVAASFTSLAYRTRKWHLGEERYPDDWRALY